MQGSYGEVFAGGFRADRAKNKQSLWEKNPKTIVSLPSNDLDNEVNKEFNNKINNLYPGESVYFGDDKLSKIRCSDWLLNGKRSYDISNTLFILD